MGAAAHALAGLVMGCCAVLCSGSLPACCTLHVCVCVQSGCSQHIAMSGFTSSTHPLLCAWQPRGVQRAAARRPAGRARAAAVQEAKKRM